MFSCKIKTVKTDANENGVTAGTGVALFCFLQNDGNLNVIQLMIDSISAQFDPYGAFDHSHVITIV